jgi:glycosyltransferase involved in cell wall biosynthesis/putative flippase GtrA
MAFRVISIGTGQNIFDTESAVRRRMIEYGRLFDELHMIVFSPAGKKLENQKLSENVYLYPSNSKRRAFFLFDYLKIIKGIIREKGKKDFVVTVQDPFETGVVGLVAKLRYKLPLQVQIHTDFHNKYFILHSPLNFIRFFIAQVTLSFADSVRTVSARVAKSVGSLCENVDVLPVYTGVQSVNRKTQNKESGLVKFLTVARLEKEKDISTIIRAFAEVVKKEIDAELVIVGDGSQKNKLVELSKILNLESRIKLVGWSNNASEYYASADIYVSSSLYEGYGMSVVEAAQYGLPLVLSETGVAGEIFQNGEEAFVCKQKDVAGFADAFKNLVLNSDLRFEMGEKARKATELIKIEHEEYLRRYKELVSKAKEYFELGHGIFRRNILLRYLVAGITAASSNILLFYLFTYPLDIWYLYSSVIAYFLSFFLSFALQKFWTFRDKSVDKVHHQFIKYGAVALIGVGVNSLCMFFFVDILNIWPILAQVMTGAIIAVFNFFAYKTFIFK